MLTVVGLAGCGDDSGSDARLPEPDAGLDVLDAVGRPDARDVGPEDTRRTQPDGRVESGPDLHPNEGTVGTPCLDDGVCDPARTGDNICTSHGYSALGTLYPIPMCVGAECDPAPVGTPLIACDGGKGVCVADGTLVGSCLPGCDFDDATAARGCPKGTLCSPSFYEREVATGAVKADGWCAPACTTDADCFGTDHCLVDEGLCIGIPITRVYTIGARCDAYANPPEIECNCFHDPVTGVGVCTQRCDPLDATTLCPSGYLCTTALPKALFPTEPRGVVAQCLPTCTKDEDCAIFVGHCAEGPSGKTCVAGAPAEPAPP